MRNLRRMAGYMKRERVARNCEKEIPWAAAHTRAATRCARDGENALSQQLEGHNPVPVPGNRQGKKREQGKRPSNVVRWAEKAVRMSCLSPADEGS